MLKLPRDLQISLAEHVQWFDSGAARGVRAVLKGADMSGLDLSGAFLSGADLREANFEGTMLVQGSFRLTDFRGINLQGADLSEADLSGANLAGANLRNAKILKAKMEKVPIVGATGEKTGLGVRTDLRGALLEGASLLRTDLFAALVDEE